MKGEICGCDLVALPVEPAPAAPNGLSETDSAAPPLPKTKKPRAKNGAAKPSPEDSAPLVVIGELKQRFTLELLLQGVDRMAAGDEIWLAVRSSSKSRKRADGRLNDRRVRKLCRLLGFGLLAVSARGRVDMLVEPTALQARAATRAAARACCASTSRRQGDPAVGGGTRQPIMTAYRQQALAVAQATPGGDAGQAARSEAPGARRAEDPAAQRLRLVRAGRARGVRADGGGAGGGEDLGGRREHVGAGFKPAQRCQCKNSHFLKTSLLCQARAAKLGRSSATPGRLSCRPWNT